MERGVKMLLEIENQLQKLSNSEQTLNEIRDSL